MHRVLASVWLLGWRGAILLLPFGFIAPTTSFAVIPLQNQCSSSYDAARSFCEPVDITEWRWYINLGYGVPWKGPFASQAQALAIPPDWFESSWCSTTLNHIDHDVVDYPPQYGVEVRQLHSAHYDTYSPIPTCQGYYDYSAALDQRRDVRCPDPAEAGATYTLVYESGNPSTPYCAIPWTKVRKQECGLPKGNPCDVTLGNKTQTETDYRGAGDFPLRFQRTYLSNIARSNYYTFASRNFFNPLGIGWTATYFQRVDYRAYAGHEAAIAYRPNGQTRTFKPNGSVYLPDDDVADRLVRLTDGQGATTGWQYITANDETETYDAIGKLLSIQSRNGITQTLTYGSELYPTAVTDSFGHQITFEYGGENLKKLESVSLPDGGEILYAYDAKENLSTVTYPDEDTRTYHYELLSTLANLLTGITDESATRFATWGYQSDGRVTSSEHAGAVDRYAFVYNANGTRVVTDPLLQARTYGTAIVSGSRRATSSTLICMGCGESKANTYDTDGNVTSRIDFNDSETRFAHDLARNLETSRTEAYGTAKARTITTQWHATFRLPTQIDEPNRRTTFTHDSSGNVLTRTVTDLSVTPNVARTWTFTYNSFGQVLTVDGPRTDVSDVTTFTYHACSTGFECGELETVTNALGHVTSYDDYNAHGQPLSITDPNGVVTTLAYDARQRVTSFTVGGEETTFEYWPTGQLKKTTLPDGSFLQYTYDAAQRLTQVADAQNNRIVYTLDDAGNRTKEEAFDPSGALTALHHRAFNTLNQLWKEIGADNTAAVTTTFGYDLNGNQTSAAAPLGRNSSNLYDELNRLRQITDPASGITLLGYDANDNLTSVTDPRGKVTTYTYTGFGEVKELVSPDTGTALSTYDSGGNLATSTDARGETGTYLYDALNRVTGSITGTNRLRSRTTRARATRGDCDSSTTTPGRRSGPIRAWAGPRRGCRRWEASARRSATGTTAQASSRR
jgi:YD repeat-containing protein